MIDLAGASISVGLGYKEYADAAGQAKRFREELDALEIKRKRLKAADLAAVKVKMEEAANKLDDAENLCVE